LAYWLFTSALVMFLLGATGGTDPPSDGVPPPCASSPPGSVAAAAAEELVTLKVTFDKKRYDVTVNLDYTIGQLKKHLEPLIGRY